MGSPEIRVGNQNKLVPHDIKVGIACTYYLGEGIVKAVVPIIKFEGPRFIEQTQLGRRK